MDSPVKKIQVAKQKCDDMCTVVSSWLRSSYTGSSSCGLMKQGVLPRIIFADLPVLRYVPCAAVSRYYSQNLQKLENKSCRLQDSRNCNFSTPWNTPTHKKTLLVGAQTLKIENSVALHRVDMNMITQLRFDYVCDVQTLLQSTVPPLVRGSDEEKIRDTRRLRGSLFLPDLCGEPPKL